ncbi:MAG TPA: amino acid adenylation domain-containing protein, partial [Thermoanaerobaculia bacterium]|nr:amino acid adenylation domain-containing protein [Thermoanaerobaculia bacterium]
MRADLFAFPTSFTQQRLWFLDQLQSRSSFYNVFKLFSFEARLNEQALESALNEIVRRHESLRTTFPSIDGRPYQLVSSHLHLSLRVFDLRSLPRGEQQQEKSRVTNDEASAPFDLAHGPLLRASLVRLSNAESTLLITMHHIITDGWSMELFSKELSTLYDAYRTNRPSPLPELPLQYADFAVWQRKWLDGDVSREQLAYWKTKLAGAPAVIDLPWDRRRPAVQSFEGGNQSFALSENVSRDVLAFSRAEGVTIFTTLLAAFQVLLARLSHSRDIVVGTPLAGRTHTELEGLIGFFVNTLALRTDVSGNPTWREMVHRTESTAMEAYANQDLPFDRIVAELAPDRTLAHSPVVQVMFALQSFLGDAIEPESEWSGDDHDEEFSGNEGDVDPGTAKFDLTMTMFASDDILAGQIEYSRDLIDPETAERWALLYTRVLEALAANPDGRVEDVPLLDAEERRIAIEDWNQTDTAYPRNATLAELFAEQANANPDALAIAYGDATLTYRELDDRSRQLAQRLLAAGVAVGDRVGVCLERSPDLIAAILAVVRAGAAYVPLDAKYPASRIRLIAEDAAVRLLVTAESFETLPPASEAPLPKTSADSIAYVMYTSGSTGLPKGVAVPQRAITRLVRNTNYIDITPADRIGQASNIAFDAATFEIWGALLNGAAIVGIDRDTALTPRNYAAALRRESISLLFVTTGLFNQIAREVPDAFRTVRQVMVGGETVDPEFMGIVLKAGRPGRLLNAYGPTETTTFATTFEIESVNGDEPIPIGRPIGNTQTYVLDEHLEPQPVGVIGELYIGGDGVAAGYFNAPELTAQKFIDDPFRPGQRLYRTGDRARYRADGAIEFLGRRDTQVKIRGFRVETGEIESVLVAHPAVREAAVQTSGGKGTPQQLNGYVVWNEGTHFPMTDLRLWVGSQLPDYMVPGRWIELESLPLNANGKVDRHALPAPDSDRPDLEVTYTAPRNATEHQISAIWSQLTGIEKIGVEDNFFEIGGHSLLATQVVSRLRDRLGVDMPVRVIFERPTVAGLAEWVSEGKLARSDWSMRQIARRTTPGPAPLSFSQQRLWFLDQLDPDSILYNINDVVHYAGELNVSALENALSELHRRHETLRTTFASLDGIAVQFVGPPAHVTLPVTDLSSMRRAEAEAEYAKLAERHGSRPYDLAKGPLFRVRLIKVGNGDHRLLIGMHHIISDGWSLGVLHRELETLYAAYAAGKAPEREELPIQYADFAVWQRNRLQGEVLAELREWWLAHLAGAPPVINLPTDRPRPAVQTFQGETQTKSLTPSLARTLTELGQRAGATLFMTLLAAWYVLLHRFSGEEEIVVGTPIAGRTHSELEPLIGFFVNTLVIRASITGNPTFREVLRQVRDAANGAYAHQDLPFERLVAELAPERRLSHTPLFQCFFALQNDRAHNETHGEIETVPSTSMFDLSLTMLEHGGTLAASFEYSTELFDTPTITRLMGHLERLLEGIAADPDQPIFSYAILGEAERTRVIHEFNATAVPYPHATSVIALFEERVRQSPDAIAVRFEDRELTYAQLDASANNLATHLTRDTLVGLSMERSCEMIIALVGILKAGAAYVPLDPNYPKHRLAQIQSDANLSTIINDTNAPVWSAAATAAAFVCSEREAPGPLQPAYVIYTSGSTGQPKGVPIHHRALLNYVEAASEQYEITSRDRVLQFASINFDASIEEIWPTLTRGATLVLRTPMMVASVAEFLARCDEWRVTVVSLPTAFWHEVVDRIVADRLTIPPRLRLVIIGGDRALPDRVSQWQRHVKHVRNVRLMNTYGPTEATVVATIYPVGRKALPAGEVPIGKPIRNTRVYILDAHGQPVPIGVRGELCIAGDGLSLGYLHRPELTAQKFFDDPFIENQRVYRSGDLARWKSDGNLEFCGRVDRQVKVRGFRIELDEIETILNDHEAVKDSVVVTHEHPPGNKRLIAYIVPDLSHRSDDSAKPQKVGEWEAVFDDLYAEVDPQQAASFYIKGWDSSYTGEPMPADEVETWMNQTVERITSLHPKRIREIGSGGSGLMLFRLAPFCDSYTGTDLSDKALAVLQHQLDSREPIPGVSLVHCPAHAQNLAPDSVDAVLIVSVAQYFPNIDYLLEVLERAIEGIAPGGFLFLGDIRNHSLLDAFHASVQLFQAEPSLSVSELNRRIRKHHAREKQLTVDPAFFHALLTRIPKITAVETRLLRGRNRNELTRFRYDAILHVGTPAVSPSVEWQPWPHLSSRALSEGPGREG